MAQYTSGFDSLTLETIQITHLFASRSSGCVNVNSATVKGHKPAQLGRFENSDSRDLPADLRHHFAFESFKRPALGLGACCGKHNQEEQRRHQSAYLKKHRIHRTKT